MVVLGGAAISYERAAPVALGAARGNGVGGSKVVGFEVVWPQREETGRPTGVPRSCENTHPPRTPLGPRA